MLSADNPSLDTMRAMCATAWIIFLLIIKNIVLLVILAIQRRKHAIYRIPEDINTLNSGREPIETTDEWSLAGRIQKVLANDAEYVPYFLALFIIIFFTTTLTSPTTQVNHYYLVRVLVYGIIFTIGRYLHTISYLLRNSYGRILGFVITILVLFIISLDHVYYMTKQLTS